MKIDLIELNDQSCLPTTSVTTNYGRLTTKYGRPFLKHPREQKYLQIVGL